MADEMAYIAFAQAVHSKSTEASVMEMRLST